MTIGLKRINSQGHFDMLPSQFYTINFNISTFSYIFTRFNLEVEGSGAADIDFTSLQTSVNADLGLDTSLTYNAMLNSTVSKGMVCLTMQIS